MSSPEPIHHIADINPEALLTTIQGLMNSISQVKTDMESLKNHVAEALGIVWRRAQTSENKSAKRFKVFKNKIKTMETSIRILQDRLNVSFMNGSQQYNNSNNNQNNTDSFLGMSPIPMNMNNNNNNNRSYSSPVGSRNFLDASLSPNSPNSVAAAQRLHELVAKRFASSSVPPAAVSTHHGAAGQLSYSEMERRRALLEVARHNKRKQEQQQQQNKRKSTSKSSSPKQNTAVVSEEVSSSDSDESSSSVPPPSFSPSPSRSLAASSPSPSPVKRNKNTPSPSASPSSSSPALLTAPVFVSLLGADLALVHHHSTNSASKNQNSSYSGCVVVRVPHGSPLEASGVQVGDRIVEVDGSRLQTPQDLAALLKKRRPQQKQQSSPKSDFDDIEDQISADLLSHEQSTTICVVPAKQAVKLGRNIVSVKGKDERNTAFDELAQHALRLALPMSPGGHHHGNSSRRSPPSHHSPTPAPTLQSTPRSFNGAAANGSAIANHFFSPTHSTRNMSTNSHLQNQQPRWH